MRDWRSIDRSTDTDLKDVMSDQAAIRFGGGNGVSQWVTIRGMGQDQIDYVVDDASSDAQIFHHQGRFMIDPALVRIIKVEKGTGSASSGIGATSGKIEATTVDAQDLLREGQNVGFRVNAGLNSNKGKNGNFSVYGRTGKFDGLLTANRVDMDNYKDGNGKTVGNSALDARSFLFKGGINMTDTMRLTLSHRQEQESGLRNLREEFFFDTANDNPRHRERTVNTTTARLTGQQIGFVDTLDLNFSHMTNEQETRATSGDVSTVNIDSNVANLRLSSRIGIAHRIKYGLNFRQQDGKPSSAATAGLGSQKKTDTGAYVEGIWSWRPITLTTGLRYDHFKATANTGQQMSEGNLNPSVGLIWDISDNLSLNISHNRATRSPRFYEVMLGNRRVQFANSLKAERSKNTEIGFDWDSNGFSVSGSYFHQKITHLQSFRNVSGVYYSSSAAELTNRGYELNAGYRWGGLTARVGVAYSKPKVNGATYDSVATAIPMGRQWTTRLTYKIGSPNIELSWRGRYAQKGSYINSTRGGGTAVNRSGYGVHDIYVTWQPLAKDNLLVNFGINNVADKHYRSHSQRSGASALPEPGREVRLSINYRY